MQIYKLRCTNCGAPLPEPKPGVNWVKCEYCGFVNRIIDASHYTESLRLELEKWIRELIPSTMITSTTIDVAARHQIFQNLIRPKINLTRSNLRAKYLQYLSKPLTILDLSDSPKEDSKQYFEETMRIERLKEFAVSEDDQRFLNEALLYGYIVAYLINMLRALSRNDILLALKNCEEAINVIPDAPELSLVKERLRAIHTTLTAYNELWNRNTSASLTLLRNALDLYRSLLDKVSNKTIPEANSGVLEAEKTVAEALLNIFDSANRLFMAGEDPLKIMVWFEKFLSIFGRLREIYKRPLQDMLEITSRVREIVYSKTGAGELPVVKSGGAYYIPYYVVETKFSYVKGTFFRRGVNSSINIFVSGISPLVEDPVLDVFGLGSGRVLPPDKIEDSPTHNIIKEILSRVVRTSISSQEKTLPTIINSVTAEKIVDSYIMSVNSYYRGKITFASSSANELIYIGFRVVDKKTLDFEGRIRIRLREDIGSLDPLII